MQDNQPKPDKFLEMLVQGIGLGAGIAIGGALIVNFLPKHIKALGQILKKS